MGARLLPRTMALMTRTGERRTGDRVRPLVGITAGSYDLPIAEGVLPSYCVDRCNPRAVVQAGGNPVLIPAVDEADEAAPGRYAAQLDAFVIAGGVDIAPSTYGGRDAADGTGSTTMCVTSSRSSSFMQPAAWASPFSESAGGWS